MSRSASFSGVSFFIKTLCGLVLSSLTLQCRVVNCTCFSCLCSSVTSTTLVKSLENTEKPRAEVREEFCHFGTSLVVQWLRLCASNAGDMGSIPGQGTKIPHACRARKKKKKTNQKTELCCFAAMPREDKVETAPAPRWCLYHSPGNCVSFTVMSQHLQCLAQSSA